VLQRYDVFLETVRDLGFTLDTAVDWRDEMKFCSGFTIGDMRRLVASCSTHAIVPVIKIFSVMPSEETYAVIFLWNFQPILWTVSVTFVNA
jgi:hypothetical protein